MKTGFRQKEMSLRQAVRFIFVDGPQRHIITPWLANVLSQMGTQDVYRIGPASFARMMSSLDIGPTIYVIETPWLFANPRMVVFSKTAEKTIKLLLPGSTVDNVYCSSLDSTYLGRTDLQQEMNAWTVGGRYQYNRIQFTDDDVSALAKNILA